MPLDDALPFLSRNFDNFVEMMKQKITALSEWVAPEKKVSYLMNLLADGKRVSMDELMEVDQYVQTLMKKLSGASTMDRRTARKEEPSINRPILDTPSDRGGINRSMNVEMNRGEERRHGMNIGMVKRPSSRETLDMGLGDRDRGMNNQRDSLLQRPRDEGLFC